MPHQIGQQLGMQLFQYGQRLITRNSREAFEKFVERLPAFDVVEQILHWNASAGKTWSAAHPFRIDPHDAK